MPPSADGTEAYDPPPRREPILPPLRRLLGESGPTPPWDDTAPIRAELFSVERMEDHARSLAAADGTIMLEPFAVAVVSW